MLIYFIKDTNGWREQMTNRISPFRRIHLLQRVSERIRADHVQQIQLYRRRSIAPEEWAESWHGKSGLAKTRILSINKDIMLEAFTPTMEGHAVTVTDNHRHLGVVLSEDLKWSKHAKCIMAAASKRAGLLSLMARDLLLSLVSILYVYCVRPVLEDASPVWHGSLREEDAMSLERIQACVARSFLQADWFTPKEELFRQLGWPALGWRRKITSLTMFHKLLHSRSEPLSDCLFQYASATSARSCRKPFQLLLPHTHAHHTLQRIFFYRSALLWNSLPHDTQSLKNSKSFRDALENHYQWILPQQETFTYHSPLPFLSLPIVCSPILGSQYAFTSFQEKWEFL